MTTDIANTSDSLPANAAALAGGLAASANLASSGRRLFLKMEKSGHWVYGANDDPVDAESLFAVNPNSFVHGWICWGDQGTAQNPGPKKGTRCGETMVSATLPLPECPAAIEDATWSKQFGLQLQGYEGEELDMEFSWNANSVGGARAYGDLLNALVKRITDGHEAYCPIIELGSESYKHKQYGKLYNPTMEVVGWMTIEGVEDESFDPEQDALPEPPAPKPKPKKTRAKKEAAPAAEETPPPAVDDESGHDDGPAPTTRRRRRRA